MTMPRRIVVPTVVCMLGYLVSLSAAVARPAPPADDGATAAPTTPPPPTQTIVHTGSPMWTFILVAGLAVLLTLIVTFGIAWLRRRRREASAAMA
jgi:hypothetical protein